MSTLANVGFAMILVPAVVALVAILVHMAGEDRTAFWAMLACLVWCVVGVVLIALGT